MRLVRAKTIVTAAYQKSIIQTAAFLDDLDQK